MVWLVEDGENECCQGDDCYDDVDYDDDVYGDVVFELVGVVGVVVEEFVEVDWFFYYGCWYWEGVCDCFQIICVLEVVLYVEQLMFFGIVYQQLLDWVWSLVDVGWDDCYVCD